MKKTIIIGLMLLTVLGSVFAGDIDVHHKWNPVTHRFETTYTIDADTLEGMTSDEIIAEASYDDSKVLRKIINNNKLIKTNTKDIEDNSEGITYLLGNEQAYLSDRKGVSMKGVKEFLFGEFFDLFLKDNFVLKSDYDVMYQSLSDRLDFFEARELDMSIDDYQKLKAKELGSYGKYTYQEVEGVDYYYR